MGEITIAQIIFFPFLAIAIGYAIYVLATIITDHFFKPNKEDK